MTARRIAALTLAGLLCAACGSTVTSVPDGTASGQALERDGITSPGEASGPGGSMDDAGGAVAGGSSGGSTSGVVDPREPAVGGSGTSTGTSVPRGGLSGTLKVGVIIPTGNAGRLFGLDPVDTPPDQARAEINALVKHFEKSSGLGGRRVRLSYAEYDRTDESQANAIRMQSDICTRFTEDEKVDLVVAVANASTVPEGNACFARHRVPVYTHTVGADEQYDKAAPWVMPPFVMSLSRMARLMPVSLQQQGFMSQRMGVFTYDNPTAGPTARNELVPGIARHGGKVLETVYARPNADGFAADLGNAVLSFKTKGINRVIVWAPGGGTWLAFAQAAESQGYRPRYGINTLDSPNFTGALVPREQLKGTVGPGVIPTVDVAPSTLPPPSARQKFCWDLLNKATGSAYRSYDTPSLLALDRCETFFSLQRALVAFAGRQFVRAAVRDAFFAAGTDYDSFFLPKLGWNRSKNDAVQVFAPFAWDDAGCGCFRYTGRFRDIPPGV